MSFTPRHRMARGSATRSSSRSPAAVARTKPAFSPEFLGSCCIHCYTAGPAHLQPPRPLLAPPPPLSLLAPPTASNRTARRPCLQQASATPHAAPTDSISLSSGSALFLAVAVGSELKVSVPKSCPAGPAVPVAATAAAAAASCCTAAASATAAAASAAPAGCGGGRPDWGWGCPGLRRLLLRRSLLLLLPRFLSRALTAVCPSAGPQQIWTVLQHMALITSAVAPAAEHAHRNQHGVQVQPCRNPALRGRLGRARSPRDSKPAYTSPYETPSLVS